MKTKTKTAEKKPKTKVTWVKKGMLGSLFQRKKQTLRKEKAKKNFFVFLQKGVDGQKAKKKYRISKGTTKAKQGKKTEKEKRSISEEKERNL